MRLHSVSRSWEPCHPSKHSFWAKLPHCPSLPAPPTWHPSKQRGCQGLQVLGSLVPEDSPCSLECDQLGKAPGALLKLLKSEDNVSGHFQHTRFDSFPALLRLVLQTHRCSCPWAILTSSWVWNDLRRNKDLMCPFSFQVAIGQNWTVRQREQKS